MRAEDDVHAVALVVRPTREPVVHARGERLDEPGCVVIARHVLEVDPPPVELEPVGDLLLVARDRERAELRCEDEPDRVRDPVGDHLAHDLLDPGRPVPHPEVAAVALAELVRQRLHLHARDLEQRRAAADRAVVLGDLLEDGRRGRPTGADVGQVAGDLLERRRRAIRHHEHADRELGRHDVRSCTCATSRRTLSSGVCGTIPWPRLKT